MAGSFATSYNRKVKIKLPKLNVTAQIFAPFHVTSQKKNYDVIYCSYLLQELGINFDLHK